MRNPADVRSRPVKNWHPNPRLDVSTATAFFVANGSIATRIADARFGPANCLKIDFPSGGVADSGVGIMTGITTAKLGGVGRKYTIAFDAYSDIATALRLSRQGGSSSGSPGVEAFALPAGQIVRRSFSFQTLSNAAISMYVLRGVAGQTGTILLNNFDVVEGAYTGPHRDGSFPGWRWLGAAGGSESIGYPRP